MVLIQNTVLAVWTGPIYGPGDQEYIAPNILTSPLIIEDDLDMNENEIKNMSIFTSGLDAIEYKIDGQKILDVNINTDRRNVSLGLDSGSINNGAFNTFIGSNAGKENTTNASDNTFIGDSAGMNNTTGSLNTFIGRGAGEYNETGEENTFVGLTAGTQNTTGEENTFIGKAAGLFNKTGKYNTFVGFSSGDGTHSSSGNGNYNTFVGYKSGFSIDAGEKNTFIGKESGYSNTTGNGNTFLGLSAGYSNTTGNNNVFLGHSAGYNEIGSNKLYISNSYTETPLIYGDFSTNELVNNGMFQVKHALTDANQNLIYANNKTYGVGSLMLLQINGDDKFRVDSYGTMYSNYAQIGDIRVTEDLIYRPNGNLFIRGGGSQNMRPEIELTNAGEINISTSLVDANKDINLEVRSAGGEVNITGGGLNVEGGIKVGDTTDNCNSLVSGTLRFINNNTLQICYFDDGPDQYLWKKIVSGD